MAGLIYLNKEWIPNWAWEKNDDFLSWLEANREFLPTPSYSLNDEINFKWNNSVARKGKITQITLVFNHKFDKAKELTENKNIVYDVYWNGHSRWVSIEYIVKE